MEQKVLKVIYGLSADTNHETKKLLTDIAAAKGYQITWINRYRKEGVLQYLEEHPDFNTVLLQEVLQQSSPYTAEDLSLLTDNQENVNVVVSLDPKHYGNRYMHILYAAGIHNAIYDTDAYAEQIVELLIKKRPKKEARSYYGIPSVAEIEQEFHILPESKKQSYLRYLLEGGPADEMIKRYEFLENQLSTIQNIYFIQDMTDQLKDQLQNNSTYQFYCGYLKKNKRQIKNHVQQPRKQKDFPTRLKVKVKQPLQQRKEGKENSKPVIISSESGIVHLFYL